MGLVDSHMHVHYHGLDASGVVREMDCFNIDLAWILTWHIPPDEDVPSSHRIFSPLNLRPDGTHAGAPLSDIIDAFQKYSDRFVPGYCPWPGTGHAADEFEGAVEMHGVRVCGEWSFRMLLDDPRSIDLFRRAGKLRCPVVLHLDVPFLPNGDGLPIYQEYWYGGMPGPLERALQACPDTHFIGHAPGFWRYISGDAEKDPNMYPQSAIQPDGELLRLLDSYPNLYADLSAGSGLGALVRDVEYGKKFLIKYSDRLLYGRDAPGNALQDHLRSLDLPLDVWERITRLNANSLINL